MAKIVPVMLWLMLNLLINGCGAEKPMKSIRQVVYSTDSGSILPEMQWHEEITITTNTVLLKRNGKVPETQVNTGSWEIPVDKDKAEELFEQLEAVDWSIIKRIEPEDAPDGGGSERFTITFAGGETYSLEYIGGSAYTNGEWITGPIRDFLEEIAYPAEWAVRYKLP